MRDTPVKHHGNAWAALALYLILAALGIVGRSLLHSPLRFVFLGVGAAALILALQTASRFLLGSYEYYLTAAADLDRHNDLTVLRIQAGRRTTSARLFLSDLVGIEFSPARKALKKKYGPIGRYYDYCPDLFPRDCYVFVFRYGDGLVALSLQCADAFALTAKARAPMKPPSA